MMRPALLLTLVLTFCLSIGSNTRSAVTAQEAAGKADSDQAAQASAAAVELNTPNTVEIEPIPDRQIEERLLSILKATSWYEDPQVRVDQGVVFLSGRAQKEEHRTWASDVAKKTEDVVAVVNQIRVPEVSTWDLTPAWTEFKRLSREMIEALPAMGISLVVLLLAWFAVGWSIIVAEMMLRRRIKSRLLVNVFSRAVGVAVFILGLYLALRVSGLAQMAATVLGGTGLIGLVLGIAFRDIAENFLASILISMQRPFALGDLIDVSGHRGIVQSVTTRGTLLMTEDGNHVQIPNASVYKSVIRNLTANPNVRCDFSIGITYDNCVSAAQEVILAVLQEHDAILKNPDPQVLVEELTATAVNLRVYFWVDAQSHSATKVRSSVLRLTKSALEEANIYMPATAGRKKAADGTAAATSSPTARPVSPDAVKHADDHTVANAAEGKLESDQDALTEQARKARKPEAGTNLLTG